MNTYLITYPDGTTEEVSGSELRVWDGVLTVDMSHSTSYNRRSRSWPLTSIRSWEKL